MTHKNTELYIFTDHGNQEENGTSDFRKPCSIFDHIQNQGAEAVVSITSGQNSPGCWNGIDTPRAQPKCQFSVLDPHTNLSVLTNQNVKSAQESV